MGDWNLGSVATAVLNLVEDVPTLISGQLVDIADRKRQYVEDYTGIVVDANHIPLKYQDVVMMLTAAEACNFMNLYGVDATSFSLGDFSVNMGGETNLQKVSERLQEQAEQRLKQLGRRITSFKANG